MTLELLFTSAIKRIANLLASDDEDSETEALAVSRPSPSAGQTSVLGSERLRMAEHLYTDDLPAGQIRLLQPIKSQSHAYHLINVKLDDKPRYHALSYAWGTLPATIPIELDGSRFLVTKNLYLALEQLDRTSSPAHWIDAICINQTKDEEKNVQVQQMTRIYENAERVFVWLRDREENSDAAFDLLRSFGSPDDENNFAEMAMSSFVNPKQTPMWTALAWLLARSYWTRAWIFQELVVSNDAEVWCGESSCHWNILAALAFVVEEHRDRFQFEGHHGAMSIMANHHHLCNLALYQRQRRFSTPPSLSEALPHDDRPRLRIREIKCSPC